MIKSRQSASRFLAAASVLLCIPSTTNAQDKVLLRINLHPGQTFDQGYVKEIETSNEIPKLRDITDTTHFGFHKEVLAVDKDGNIKLKLTYKKVTTSIRGYLFGKAIPPQKDVKPSKKDASALSFSGIDRTNILVTITPQGKVVKMEGLDAIIQRMGSGFTDPQERARIQAMVEQDLESSNISSTGILQFPEAPVAVGDSWTIEVSVPTAPLMSIKHTLMSSKDGVATLAERVIYSSNPKAPLVIDQPKLKMKSDTTGTMSGVVRVDEKTGLTISSELHLNLKNVLSITVPGSTPKSKPNPEIPSSITNYIKGVIRSWTVKLPQ